MHMGCCKTFGKRKKCRRWLFFVHGIPFWWLFYIIANSVKQNKTVVHSGCCASTKFLVFPISTRVGITVHQHGKRHVNYNITPSRLQRKLTRTLLFLMISWPIAMKIYIAFIVVSTHKANSLSKTYQNISRSDMSVSNMWFIQGYKAETEFINIFTVMKYTLDDMIILLYFRRSYCMQWISKKNYRPNCNLSRAASFEHFAKFFVYIYVYLRYQHHWRVFLVGTCIYNN